MLAVGIEKIVFSEYSPYENITAGTSANMSYVPFFFPRFKNKAMWRHLEHDE